MEPPALVAQLRQLLLGASQTQPEALAIAAAADPQLAPLLAQVVPVLRGAEGDQGVPAVSEPVALAAVPAPAAVASAAGVLAGPETPTLVERGG